VLVSDSLSVSASAAADVLIIVLSATTFTPVSGSTSKSSDLFASGADWLLLFVLNAGMRPAKETRQSLSHTVRYNEMEGKDRIE